jgi:hypothetical protein
MLSLQLHNTRDQERGGKCGSQLAVVPQWHCQQDMGDGNLMLSLSLNMRRPAVCTCYNRAKASKLTPPRARKFGSKRSCPPV